MADISTASLDAQWKPPNSVFLHSLAFLINRVYDFAGAALLTAVQGATDIDSLAAAIDALSLPGNQKNMAHQLSQALRTAYQKSMMDNTDIAAFTTINTVSATTDLLYGLCTQHDSSIDANWPPADRQGGHFETFAPSIPAI